MVNILSSTCSRKHLQQLTPISIFHGVQSLAYEIVLRLFYRNCRLRSNLECVKLSRYRHHLQVSMVSDAILIPPHTKNVNKNSSVNNFSRLMIIRKRFTNFTRDFHVPPIQRLIGGSNFHFILFVARYMFN